LGAVCGAIGAAIGGARGQAGLGFLVGFLFGPVGLIVACLLPEAVRPPRYGRSHATDFRPRADWLDGVSGNSADEGGDPLSFLKRD